MDKKQLFAVTVKYVGVTEEGLNKAVTEQHLVDALSFTEAEARIVEEFSGFNELDIANVARKKVVDIIRTESTEPCWWEAVVNFITIDEKTGMEKATPMRYLIEANNFDASYAALKQYFGGSVAEICFVSMKQTKFIEYYEYNNE